MAGDAGPGPGAGVAEVQKKEKIASARENAGMAEFTCVTWKAHTIKPMGGHSRASVVGAAVVVGGCVVVLVACVRVDFQSCVCPVGLMHTHMTVHCTNRAVGGALSLHIGAAHV